MDVDQEQKGKTAKAVSLKEDSFQLVEHSPDELEAVNRDVLNAEITQLEGRSTPSDRKDSGRVLIAPKSSRGSRSDEAQSERSCRV